MRLVSYVLLAIAALISSPSDGEPAPCPASVWRLADGDILDLGAIDRGTRRWRKFDGVSGELHPGPGDTWTSTQGWTHRADGKTATLTNCAEGRLRFDGEEARRIDLDLTETAFSGDPAAGPVNLVGRLVLPKGSGPVSIVVLLHGSEDASALEFNQLQRLLPAAGVGAFVYDKRGTGASGGRYTQDFSVLAGDGVSALREARRLAGGRAGRIGYFGPSQGGWVAPLAANRAARENAPVDFVMVGSGLAVSPLEQNRAQVRLEMQLKGYGPAKIEKAMEVVRAGETVVTSNLTRGFAAFDRVRGKYRTEPWYKDLHGNYTYMMLPLDQAALLAAHDRFVLGTPWRYDPMPALRASRTPQLWILGEDDLLAPSAKTAKRIAALGRSGRSFTLAIFPKAAHGIYQYEPAPDGTEVPTRNAEGYFAMLRDYARDGVLAGPYGAAKVTAPKR